MGAGSEWKDSNLRCFSCHRFTVCCLRRWATLREIKNRFLRAMYSIEKTVFDRDDICERKNHPTHTAFPLLNFAHDKEISDPRYSDSRSSYEKYKAFPLAFMVWLLSFFLSLLYHRNSRKAIQPVVACPALCNKTEENKSKMQVNGFLQIKNIR